MPGVELDLTTLTGERWFAGKHRTLVRVLDAGSLPLPGGSLRLAEAHYDDRAGSERYLLPAAGIDWPAALRQLLSTPIQGSAGRLRLRLGPGTRAEQLPLAGRGHVSVPSLDQSNTLLAIDDALLIKLYRRPLPGVHPEIEIGEALVGREAPVARHHAALELIGPDGETTAVGCLQEFIAGADGGWEWPIALALEDFRAGGVSGATLALAAATGRALRLLHLALAEALGTWPCPDTGALEEYRLATADADALTAVAAVSAQTVSALRPSLEALLAGGEPLQRIHGDLHIAQFLRTGDRLTVIDFEGNPTLTLAARRAPGSPLRDLATLRRSFDHVATAADRRLDPAPGRAARWSGQVLAEILHAYRSQAPGTVVDPSRLYAFEVAAELRELRYAQAVLPEWAYVAHAGLERLAASASINR